jgi:hypothetical protein
LFWSCQPCSSQRATSFASIESAGPVWYAKYRLPDGRQVQKKIGPAWTERGNPPAGYVTKRLAEAWLRNVLDQARRGTLPGMVRRGATFADAAAEFLRYVADERDRKPSTLRDYRSVITAHLLPRFADELIEDITPAMIEEWGASLGAALASRTKNKLLVVLHGVFRRAQNVGGLPANPVAGIEKHRERSSARAATSTSSRPRRCSRSFARPATSRTPRSTSRPPSRVCALAT